MNWEINEQEQNKSGFLYQGVGEFRVIAFNPSKEDWEKLLHYERRNDYTGQTTTGTDYFTATFIMETVKTDINGGIKYRFPFDIRLYKKFQTNADDTMVRVIDNYGQCVFVDKAMYTKQEVPEGSTVTPPYRSCYQGQQTLVDFLRTLYNLPDPIKWDKEKGKFIKKDDVSKSFCALEKVKQYFEGDFKELEEIVMPVITKARTIRLLLGIKTSKNGKLFTQVYDRLFLKGYVQDFEYLKKHYEKNKEYLKDFVTEIEPLRHIEDKPDDISEPTQVQEESEDGLPF